MDRAGDVPAHTANQAWATRLSGSRRGSGVDMGRMGGLLSVSHTVASLPRVHHGSSAHGLRVAARQTLAVALYRRVVLINTGLLIAAALVLALSPATISQHVTTEEWIVLGAGTALAVAVNIVLLRRVFGPLERLRLVMRAVSAHEPGRRAGVDSPVDEVAGVLVAFNDMLDRLESERAASARRALQAQEGERGRVARELHDEVGQVLTGVVLQLDGI